MTIAHAYNGAGRFRGRAAALERAWEIGRGVLGKEHPRTLTYMNNLAGLYMNCGKYAKAEPLLAQGWKSPAASWARRTPTRSRSWITWRSCTGTSEKLAQAEPLFVEALEVRRRVLGEDHWQTLGTMRDLAGVYLTTGEARSGRAAPGRRWKSPAASLGDEDRNITLISWTASPPYILTREVDRG